MATNFGQRYIAAMNPPKSSIARATLMIVLSALSFGSISVLTTLVTGAQISLVTVMAWRYVLAALLLAVLLITRVARSGAQAKVPRKQIVQLLLIGGLGQALITYVSLRALDFIPVGPLAFLFYTYPAWVACLAALRQTEKLTPVRIVALVVALTGVATMIGAPAAERLDRVGVTLALASAVMYAFYLPALEHVQKGVPAVISTFLLVVGAAVAFTVAATVGGGISINTRADVWVNIVLLAVVSTVIAFGALIKGLAVLGPVRTSIIATVEPFFTAILGVAVLGNQFTAGMWMGGILIAAAILMIEWSSAQAQPATP